MAAGRTKKESVPPKRYANGLFTSKLTKAKNNGKIYSAVTEVDKIGKRLKIHYVGFSRTVHADLSVTTFFFLTDGTSFYSVFYLSCRPYGISSRGIVMRNQKEIVFWPKGRSIQQLVLRYELIRIYLMEG